LNQEIINILFNFLPEISLAVTVIILNISRGIDTKVGRPAYYIFVFGILLSSVFSIMQAYYAPQSLFSGAITADHFSYGGRVIVSSAMLFIALAFYNRDSENEFTLVLVSLTGALLSISSGDIFVLFISLQVMIIPLYLLIHYEIKPAIKYFIFSSLFMAVMIYGLSLIYGIAGTGSYIEVAKFLSFNPYNTLIIIIAVILVTSGFAFMILVAPYNLSFPLLAEKIRLPHLAQFAIINVVTVLFAMTRFFITVFHDSNAFITDATQYNLITA
jgi:NADH-quinone oxidoreductase subunit N